MRLLPGIGFSLALLSAALMPAVAAPPSQPGAPTPAVPGATQVTRPTATATRPPAESPTALPSPGPDARAILEASASAMDNARSMRISGTVDIQATSAGMSFAVAMPILADYQAPDRFRFAVDVAMMGLSIEGIVIGDQVWTRVGEEQWESMSPGQLGAPIDPASFAGFRNAEFVRYLLSPTLSDLGASYRVSGDLDVVGALGAGGGMGALLGDPMGMMSMDLSGITARITATINKSSLYMETMEMEMAMAMPALETGAGGQMAGNLSVTISITFSDFNSPAIDIRPPL